LAATVVRSEVTELAQLPTNPANFFHALRRQIHNKDRKPLVVMSPKSLLRHKMAISKLSECTGENFKTLILKIRLMKIINL
jgi:2-oxoglutarate dehydrogenase complex dehydrogenase (E1) component-like enzyme